MSRLHLGNPVDVLSSRIFKIIPQIENTKVLLRVLSVWEYQVTLVHFQTKKKKTSRWLEFVV